MYIKKKNNKISIYFLASNLGVLRLQPGEHQANGFFYTLDSDLYYRVVVTYYENTWWNYSMVGFFFNFARCDGKPLNSSPSS